jgi:hypothetical protein
MKTKCYSVRLESLHSISPKCYKAVAFDGSTALIPSSQVHGRDWSVNKSEAYWISAWFLDRVSIQHSRKKEAWFKDGKMLPKITVTNHCYEFTSL